MCVRSLPVLAVAVAALAAPAVARAQTPDGGTVFRSSMMYVNSGDYRARPGNVLLAYGVD